MTTDQIESELITYSEDGYLSEYVQEHKCLDEINKYIETLYNLLTPTKRKQLKMDLDTLQQEIKDCITDITDSTLRQFIGRLEDNSKADEDIENYINPAYCLNPHLLHKK
jgi:hypothetical protein